eukprot:maker-scaffold297_size217559-snap-gene-1.19 protein:Tk11593 transcript:maker-scaffold297_size217559-snap-gene-1.19-mRNA-1 annotation:"neuropeptide f receptor"
MGITEAATMSLEDASLVVTSSPGPGPNTTIVNEWLVLENFIRTMVENWRYQARVGTFWYSILVMLYASMILIGATGNLLVILVVVRNVAMRTARNVFIVNLAVSDLMLCLITMPLTLVEILYQTWQFGNYPAACPVAALLQGTSIFVSTLSITAIALDRRQLIVCPHKGAWGIKAMLASVPVIWGLALALASPMAIWKKLEYWNDWASCKEDFPESGRLVYSSITMIIQYLLPTITISIAYFQIYGQLRIRMQQKLGQLAQNTYVSQSNGARRNTNATIGTSVGNGGSSAALVPGNNAIVERIENDIERMKRTTNLLIWVGVMFCVCWLPLNILNTEDGTKVTSLTDEQFCIIYAICHVTGMLSACANPVIYGYLNENFNREFKEIFEIVRSCFHCPTRKLFLRSDLEGAEAENGGKAIANPAETPKLALQNSGNIEMKRLSDVKGPDEDNAFCSEESDKLIDTRA